MADQLPRWRQALPLAGALITVIVVIGTLIGQDLFRPSVRVLLGVVAGMLVAHLIARTQTVE